MGYITYVGRVGGLAVALGIGVALASLPAVASAKPDSAAGPNSGPNVAISHEGQLIEKKGSANAFSVAQPGSTGDAHGVQSEADSFGANDRAIANGDGSVAQAGSLAGGQNNFVRVDGKRSLAFSGSGNGNTIRVNGNGDTVTNSGGSDTITVHGNSDTVTNSGDANTITVRGNNLPPVNVTGNGQTVCFGHGCK